MDKAKINSINLNYLQSKNRNLLITIYNCMSSGIKVLTDRITQYTATMLLDIQKFCKAVKCFEFIAQLVALDRN